MDQTFSVVCHTANKVRPCGSGNCSTSTTTKNEKQQQQVHIYIRVTSKTQNDAKKNDTEEQQHAEILQFCMNNNFYVKSCVKEVGSAYDDVHTPMLNNLINELTCDVPIIVYSCNRFSRNVTECNTKLAAIHGKGSYVWSVLDNVTSKDSAFMILVQAGESDSRQKGRRISAVYDRIRSQVGFVRKTPYNNVEKGVTAPFVLSIMAAVATFITTCASVCLNQRLEKKLEELDRGLARQAQINAELRQEVSDLAERQRQFGNAWREDFAKMRAEMHRRAEEMNRRLTDLERRVEETSRRAEEANRRAEETSRRFADLERRMAPMADMDQGQGWGLGWFLE